MALSKEDREAIELAIIKTLNTRLEKFDKRLTAVDVRLWRLIVILAGTGIIGIGALRLLIGG